MERTKTVELDRQIGGGVGGGATSNLVFCVGVKYQLTYPLSLKKEEEKKSFVHAVQFIFICI